jgi:TRAP-type C4-dicarboxylate transport system permease small subunit
VIVRSLERAMAWTTRAAAPLVLAVSLLLFLQWPLRELVQAGSREANDLAQVLFALYVAIALTAATRDRTHLAADVFAHRYPRLWRERLWRAACLAIVAPAALFVIASGAQSTWLSVAGLEHFPETLNPGYFLVKVAALLLAALVLAQAILDLLAPGRKTG